ncbi:putative polysaccharide biosynthesis protein [Anaerocolumna xylanovorans]|uniref:Stage V sporulation protein B n=1 Tax=Anaerocolumna xylanovorans DSM 12503 TaxID=1121345 RepID=A0A1M7YLZ4_9FIRM|nr:polysaccharide biosynthesis protein [Anaerocolumna xylanovorans]SHO53641.1 stage V sporulation protein B [Anaerocolumna xylanovorans DSM 12503]
MSKSKSNLIKGTIILTLAGFLTRIVGFFYRIFLSNAMGAEALGVYQLVFPIYSICFTIFASGIQTAISTLVANELGKQRYTGIMKVLRNGGIISFSLALLLSFFTYHYSTFLAVHILREPATASSLRILAICFPFCGITSCINGYYYGLKKAGIPATTQLLEQIIRVLAVYFIAASAGGGNLKVTCDLAVLGIVFGEIASQLYNVGSMFLTKTSRNIRHLSSSYAALNTSGSSPMNTKGDGLTRGLIKMSIPLTANRLLISILHSVEAILIPAMLKKYGLSSEEALSIFGVLSGMSLPFILFPSAITNSLSVLLLPTISEAQSAGQDSLIKRTSAITIKYSLLIGILSTGIFISFGNELGNLVYHNSLSGSFLIILAWLCPFLYITTTLNSIINGLGLVHLTFVGTVLGLIIRIVIIIALVPMQGINGYLISLLVSQLIMTVFGAYLVVKYIHPPFQAAEVIAKPGIIVALCSFMIHRFYLHLPAASQSLKSVLLLCVLLLCSSMLLMYLTKTISSEDFK